jgi:hypothetical protein
MRYVDTGARDPSHALGSWLETSVLQDSSVIELRFQTGFFGASSLGYFAPLMARLSASDGVLSVVIGSNDGMTQAADVEMLLDLAGPPRTNRRIGIVSFENGYFHPKTVHILRSDGSAAAYIGSANLTGSGVSSLHVEAGIILETREGDDAATLTQVAQAIDWWFMGPRPGLSLVADPSDLGKLVSAGTLNVPPPAPPARTKGEGKGGGGSSRGATLKPLVGIPKLTKKTATPVTPPSTASPSSDPSNASAASSPAAPTSAHWDKKLTRSDAQRKTTGNQRGSITLVQAGHPINAQTYFRNDLFGAANWVSDTTRTSETLEIAAIPFNVNLRGKKLGVLNLEVSYALNREAAQANYTSLLHLGPLKKYFTALDMTGKWLTFSRGADGKYALSILDSAP